MNSNRVDPDNIEEQDCIERMIAGNDPPLPPELEARMRLHLNSLHARMDGLQAPSSAKQESWIMSIVRNFNQGRVRLATTAALVIAFIAAGIVFRGFDSAALSYAAVAQRIRQAQTLSFTMGIGGKSAGAAMMENMKMAVHYKAPALMRVRIDAGPASMDEYADLTQNKVTMIIPQMKQVVELDMATFKQTNGIGAMLDEWQKLPEQADFSREETLKDNPARVYEVQNGGTKKTLWVDKASAQVVQYQLELTKDGEPLQLMMTDVKIDQPIDDSLFQFTVPSDYSKKALHVNMPAPSEAALAAMLQAYVDHSKNRTFPDNIDPANPMENARIYMDVLKAKRESGDGGLTPDQKTDRAQEAIDTMAPIMAAMQFMNQIKPVNDWHYAGKNVKSGNAADWIAWWKPTGASNYRVIHGDFSITDATPEDVANHAARQ